MELGKQDLIKMKNCIVLLEKINMDKNDDSSEDDLPSLPFQVCTTKRKLRTKKSSAELLKEHQSLAQNIKGDNESFIHIEETIRRLETVEIETTVDRSSVTPDPVPCEENNDVKIFCVKNCVLFFNARDVTPAQCGYNNRCHDSFPVQAFEQKMLSFKRVEFEHVISSFLHAAKKYCISDCKSFVIFLLRTLSIHNDMTCLSSCYRTLVSILDDHLDSSSLTFSSAEIFMLLFNYGVDIDSFKFLSKWTDIKDNLEVPQYPLKNSSGIPKNWFYNIKFILKALMKILSICTFKEIDIERIIIFLMWMSKDSLLLKEDIYPVLKNCIYACLEIIRDEKWNNMVCRITNIVMSIETSEPEKWVTIYQLIDSIPNRGRRAIELRKQISFHSLRCLCLGLNQDLEENCLGVNVNELHFLLKEIKGINHDLLSYALKFFDNCVKHLDASKEEFDELCNHLKKCEVSLCDEAQNEKTHFLKILSKLRTFCGEKDFLNKRSGTHSSLNIKSESDVIQEFNDNNNDNPYDSEINNRNSCTPSSSEDSESYCTHQSDQTNSSSFEVNINNVQIKSEYEDESCILEKSSSIKLLIRKKRSSRSSSGNSLVNSELMSHIKCENEELSRQSSEFECQLLNNELITENTAVLDSAVGNSLVNSDLVMSHIKCENKNLSSQSSEFKYQLLNNELTTENVTIQDSVVDIEYPESNLILSDFSIEYPEEISNAVKIEKMDIVSNKNQIDKLLSVPENGINQNLIENDLSPLPEICEVKSIAFSNMDIDNSSGLASNLKSVTINNDINEVIEQQSPSTEIPHSEGKSMLPNYEKPVLCSASEPEIISYEGYTSHASSFNQESVITIPLTKDTSLHSAHEENLLDTDDDVVFIKETISPEKLPKTSSIEENIPSPVHRYTKAVPGLSITPIKNVLSSSIEYNNNLVDNEDIVIIEEKTPKKDTNVLKKVSSPSQSNSSLSPKNEAQDKDKITIQINVKSQEEIAKSAVKLSETNSDGEDIILVDVITSPKIKSNENKSLEVEDNYKVSLSNESVSNISHLETDSPNQCYEMLNSVLKQVEIKRTVFNSQDNASEFQPKKVFDNKLKETNVKKKPFDFRCNEILESVLEHVDPSFKEHADVIQITSNLCDVINSFDDIKSHSTDKPISNLDTEVGSTIDLSANTVVEGINLEMHQNSLETNKNVSVLQTVASSVENFVNTTFDDKSVANTSFNVNISDISNKNQVLNTDIDKNNKLNVEIDAHDLTDKIHDTIENIAERNPPSQSFSSKLQDNDNDVVSHIDNRSLELVNLKLVKTDGLDITNVKRNLFNSPVSVNTSESNIINQIQKSGISDSFPSSVSEKCDSRVSDNNNLENQNANKIAEIIIDISNKNCTTQTNVSEANEPQMIIKKSLSSSACKKSNSTILSNSKTKHLSKLSTITPIQKAKTHTMTQVNSIAQSVLKNSKAFDSHSRNLKIPLKHTILSVSDQNEHLKTKNSKILLDALLKSNLKRTNVSHKNVAKKTFSNTDEVVYIKTIPKEVVHKKNTTCFVNPSSRIKKKRSWSSMSENREDLLENSPRKTPRKYSPLKSPLSAKYTQKSPKNFFHYSHMRHKYKHFNKTSMLSRTDLNLPNVLRGQMESSSMCNNKKSNTSDMGNNDRDIIQLYIDPKRYADEECLIVYESEDIVVLD